MGDYGGEVKVWEPATGKLVRAFKPEGGGVGRMAYARGARALATVNMAWKVQLWDPETCREKNSLTEQAMAISFSPDGKLLALGTKAGNLTVRDAATLKELAALAAQGPARINDIIDQQNRSRPHTARNV